MTTNLVIYSSIIINKMICLVNKKILSVNYILKRNNVKPYVLWEMVPLNTYAQVNMLNVRCQSIGS